MDIKRYQQRIRMFRVVSLVMVVTSLLWLQGSATARWLSMGISVSLLVVAVAMRNHESKAHDESKVNQ
jgi:hypothetical protein